MAKAPTGPKGQRPHLEWFDDTPKKPRSGRGPSAAEKRAERMRVRPLAGALPRPVRLRPNRPQPAKAAGLGAKIPRSLIAGSRIRLPRRLIVSSTAKPSKRSTLASRMAPR